MWALWKRFLEIRRQRKRKKQLGLSCSLVRSGESRCAMVFTER